MSLEEQIRLIDDTIARIMSLTMRAVVEATKTIKSEDAFDRVDFLMKENSSLVEQLNKYRDYLSEQRKMDNRPKKEL
jgi:hypothetical protein